MSKTKRLLSIVLVLAMTFALFAGVTAFADETETTDAPVGDTTPVGSFTDVTWANPYAEAIAVLAAAKITTGTSDTSFGPKENVTREQVAAFIARAGLSSAKAETLMPVDTGFSDVPKDDFFSKYIGWAVSEGAINGKGDGTYHPKDNVTSIEVLKILEGILDVDKVTELTGSMWATNTMSYAIRLGLTDGLDITDYNAPATREQVAQFILNAISAPGYVNVGFYSANGYQLNYSEVSLDYVYPLFKVNGLSRRQTEDTSVTDDGTVDPGKFFDPVTPYGELYYRWQYAVNGKGITSWRHDDKNEKIIETVIANPETTGGLPIRLRDVFKVYINGAVVNAYAPGATGDGLNNDNRYSTKEYFFSRATCKCRFTGCLRIPDALWRSDR